MNKLLFGFLIVYSVACQPRKQVQKEHWNSLFNGKDLEGWMPKFAGYPVGENFKNTFRVEDGILKVDYSEYDSFRNEYGHLFYHDEFSHYRLRLEYRFTGEQVPGGSEWAIMNSGVMIHAQSPQSMEIAQSFPVCLEAQFLAGASDWERSTGNLCTPGTHVTLADTLTTQHCINSTSKTYYKDQWVTAEIIVLGDSILHHVIYGDTVLTYSKPIVGGDFLPVTYFLSEGTPLTKGYIALQSESHPVEFRKIEILVIDNEQIEIK